MKKLLIALFLIPSLSYAVPTVIVDGRLSWVLPTQMIDGSPITDPVTSNIYCNGTQIVSGLTGTTHELTALNLTGAQSCVVTATVGTTESSYSNSVNFTCSGQCIYGQGPQAPVLQIEN